MIELAVCSACRGTLRRDDGLHHLGDLLAGLAEMAHLLFIVPPLLLGMYLPREENSVPAERSIQARIAAGQGA